jgi:hypothetical protein
MDQQAPYDCVLTLALPQALEEEALDLLLAHPQWVDGFSVSTAEGFGRQVQLPSVMEQIRGRARRCLVTVLMRQAHTGALLAVLGQAFPHPQAAWWITPLLHFGRFA